MFTKTPFVPGDSKGPVPQKSAPPAKHVAGKPAPVDHKAAIGKMHPEHVHKLVQDAHAGKFGPDAQRTAQQAMQPMEGSPQDPDAQQDQQQQQPPQRNVSSIFSGQAPAAPAAPASRASMF